MKPSRPLAAAILAIAVFASPSLRAQPSDPATPDAVRDNAQQLAARAKAHFDHGEYASAADDYREAYRLWSSPGLLYNLGQAYRLAGDCPHAAQSYREYLRLQPDTPYRTTVEQNLAAATACAKSDAGGTIPTTEPPPGASPPSTLPTTTEPAPATTTPSPAPAPDATISTRSTTPSDPQPGAHDAAHARRIGGLIAIGAGAVLLAGGSYFAVGAAHAKNEVATFYDHGGAWSDISSTDARGHRDQTFAIVGYATGGVALAAGVTVYLLGRRTEHVALAPTRGGGEVVLAWSF